MARTLTSANSIITLAVAGLFDAPRQLQGFSADNIFDTDAVTNAETSMGVDGRLSAGWVPNPVIMNISLQADSLSNDFMESWYQAEQTLREKLPCTGITILPGLNKKYTMVRGFLTSYPPTSSAARTMQPRRYAITWETFGPAPI